MLAVVVLLLGADGGEMTGSILQEPSIVTLGEGGGFAISADGLFLTTHRVANALARPQALLGDGGTMAVLQLVHDDPEADVAVLLLAGDGYVPARLGSPTNLPTADGGRPGAPIMLSDGAVVGMIRAGAPPLPATDFPGRELWEARPRRSGLSGEQLRNLSISAAFFLGLTGWWVYRSRARRY